MAKETSKKKQKKRGITRRWIVGSLLWTIIILIVGVVAVLISLRENYYNAALNAIERRVERAYNAVPTVLDTTEANRESTARMLIQDFSEREKFEMMLVDREGNVILTSSGFDFDPNEPLDDFFEASESATKKASYMGYSLNGEHILAYTQVFNNPIRNQIAGIRMVTSLREVDSQLLEMAYILAFGCILVLFFSIFSGSYFIRSIVLPIRRIGNTAKRISGGDYDVRIDNKYNDEIGDLSNIINDMAAGLSIADRTKNDFISSVSHELRTPLTSIKGWGETLLASAPGDRDTFEKGMHIIMSETDRLSLMVEDLLDFSRMQTGELSIVMAPIDVIAELSEAVMTFEKRAEGLGIELLYEEPEQSKPVLADRNRIRQVFSNLLDNAIKYSRRGDTVTVKAIHLEDRITVCIEDTGIGIPEKDLGRITEKFFRASNSVTGSGIGLAVVKEIVDRHGGLLSIESELGSGTVICVSLPLYKTPAIYKENQEIPKLRS